MAAGGEVTFCSEDRKHLNDCEYFAEGGEVPADDLPQEDMPQADVPKPMESNEVPVDDLPVDMEQESNEVPPEDLPQEEIETNDKAQTMLGGAEAFARGALGPVATLAEQAIGRSEAPTEEGLEDIQSATGMGSDIAVGQAMRPVVEKGLKDVQELGFEDKDILARKEALPTGVGPVLEIAGAISPISAVTKATKAAQAAAEFTKMGKIGSSLLSGMIGAGLIQGGSEASNWLLDDKDAESPVAASLARIGAAGLFGSGASLGAQGVGYLASKALPAAEKLYSKAGSWLAGYAQAAQGLENKTVIPMMKSPEFNDKLYEAGKKAYNNASKHIIGGAVKGAAVKAAYAADLGVGGMLSSAAGAHVVNEFLVPVANSVLGKPIQAGARQLAPVAKWLAEGAFPEKLGPILQRFEQVQAGNRAIDKGVESLFKGGLAPITPVMDAATRARRKKEVMKYIDEGGISNDILEDTYQYQQPTEYYQYAEGGSVRRDRVPTDLLNQDSLSDIYPAQDMLMTAAKARISNYLTVLKPPDNQPRLAFDSKPDQTKEKRAYDQLLDIAVSPLSIIDHIKNGTILPDQVNHFKALYPEIYDLIGTKLSNKIVHAQMKGEKPSYKIRQGLSLFLGIPLSGELVPENIQAAQAVFAQQKAAAQTSPPKSSKSSLSKFGDRYLTKNQAAQQQDQKT